MKAIKDVLRQITTDGIEGIASHIQQSPSRPHLSVATPSLSEGCMACEGGWVAVEVDGVRRSKRCECRRKAIRAERLALIPAQYRKFGEPDLDSAVAQTKPDPTDPRKGWHPSQNTVLRKVQATRMGSYLFAGRNGSGKTFFYCALYRHAVMSDRRTAICSLAELLGQYKAWEMMSQEQRGEATRKNGRPLVLPFDLKTDDKWSLFLDEIEKARVTDFTSELMFQLLSMVRDFGHQLVCTTNMRWEELADKWSKIDSVYGNSIMTRLSMCELIEMF